MTAELFGIPFKTDFFLDEIMLLISSVVIAAACLALILSKNLINSIIAMAVFSLFISVCYLIMDAPDVAMTEVALGACLSTCVLLNVVKAVGDNYTDHGKAKKIFAGLVCSGFILALSWIVNDLPEFGAEDSPLQTHLTRYYIENTAKDIAIPSMVAAILASYRGFDTLGETAVILIAGLAVLVIISRRKDSDV